MKPVLIEKEKKIFIKTMKWWKVNFWPMLMVMPFLILMFVFIVLPVIVSFVLSLTQYNMIQPPEWIGFLNYKNLFTADEVFLKYTLKNTFLLAGIIGPFSYIACFIAAWIIDQLRFRNAFALAFYAPSICSGVAMSVVWLIIFSSDRYGYLNYILIYILRVTNEPILFNKNPDYIIFVVIIISLWMSLGSGFLVHLAGFRNIPREMYEAGSIDGIKNKFQELWYITVPNVMPQLLFSAIMVIVSSFGVFDIPVAVAGLPSPEYSAHTIIAHLYDHAFIRFEMGYASTIAVFLFTITFGLGRFFMKVLRPRDNEDGIKKRIFFKNI